MLDIASVIGINRATQIFEIAVIIIHINRRVMDLYGLRKQFTIIFILLLSSAASAIAEDAEPSAEAAIPSTIETGQVPGDSALRADRVIKRITVVDSPEEAAEAAGSAYFVTGEDLERAQDGVDDISRVLRQVPGVNIQEEDGYGLRPNIGFRGVPNNRSAKITLMEDSVLIAPAPYSAPAAYYFPPVGRITGIEVTKGPGLIKYGPYTNGGALNLLTRGIPSNQEIGAKLAYGTDNTLKGDFYGGKSWKYGGVMFETYQFQTDGFKELDGGGDTGYELEDYNLKLRLNTDPDQEYFHSLTYKGGWYDQISHETYLGLTDEDFGNTPNRRYAGSQLDNMDVDHLQQNLTYYGEFANLFDVTATLYYNKTQRNWYKLDSVGGSGIATILAQPNLRPDEVAWIRGADSPEGALSVRENNREFESMGVQTVVGFEFDAGETTNEVEVGVRFHYDEADRYQHDDRYTMVNGRMELAAFGEPGSQDNRVGSADAWAFYVTDSLKWNALTLTPGLRYEMIEYDEKDYGGNDPNRTGSALDRSDSSIDELIPGIGAHYEFDEQFAAFVGVHRGFSPPGPQGSSGAEVEESVAYELGGTFKRESLFSKVVFFYTDYDNLLGADTLSSGGSGSGDLFNGGEVDVYGLEFLARYDFAELIDSSLSFPATFSYTYTHSEFKDSFQSDFFGDVSEGDPVPYTPENQLYASIGVTNETFGFFLDGTYVQSMVTELGAPSGVEDETDSTLVFDATGEYNLNEHVGLFVSAENIFDREYIVARRPAGARPGLPLTILAGLKLKM